MKYNENARVHPEVEAQGRKAIAALDEHLNNMKGGTMVLIETTHYHKAPYRDTDEGYRISLYRPNSLTTNEPGIRVITEEEAKTIARILCGGTFVEAAGAEWHQRRLVSIRAAQDPAGLQKKAYESPDGLERSACWELRIITPSTE